MQGKKMKMQSWVGTNTPMFQIDSATQRGYLARMRNMRMGIARQDCHLWNLKPTAGNWVLSDMDVLMANYAAFGIEPYCYLVGTSRDNTLNPTLVNGQDTYMPANMAQWAQDLIFLMKRYPKVTYWGIWNEQNTTGFMKPKPDSDVFSGLLETVRAAVDAEVWVMPKKLVLGGMAYLGDIDATGINMLQQLNKNGGLSKVDVVAFHPYTDPNDVWTAGEEEFLKQTRQVVAMLRAAGVNEIWADEFGKSTYAGPIDYQPRCNQSMQAAWLIKMLDLLYELQIDRAFIFSLFDMPQGSDRDQNYGILGKEAEFAVKTWIDRHFPLM